MFYKIKGVKILWDYLAECVDFYELDKYIFVHSWVPIEAPDWRKATKEEWDSARWVNPFEMWHIGYKVPNKTIVCGHWYTSWAHANIHKRGTDFGDNACYDIFIDREIVGLDACTAYSHKCNCFVIEE